jgi:hypothetical protein
LPLVARLSRRPPAEPELVARGGTAAPARQAGLRAFCLTGDRVLPLDGKNGERGNSPQGNLPQDNSPQDNSPQGNLPQGNSPQGTPSQANLPQCDLAAQLKLAVSNPGGYSRVFLVGMDDSHELKWYAPKPPGDASVSAPTGVGMSEVPVGSAVRLGINHEPGRVRVYALFSDQPVRSAEVTAAAAQLAQRRVGVADAETLPLGRADVLQRSIIFDVKP